MSNSAAATGLKRHLATQSDAPLATSSGSLRKLRILVHSWLDQFIALPHEPSPAELLFSFILPVTRTKICSRHSTVYKPSCKDVLLTSTSSRYSDSFVSALVFNIDISIMSSFLCIFLHFFPFSIFYVASMVLAIYFRSQYCPIHIYTFFALQSSSLAFFVLVETPLPVNSIWVLTRKSWRAIPHSDLLQQSARVLNSIYRASPRAT